MTRPTIDAILIYFTVLRPSSFVRYYFDKDGILRMRVVPNEVIDRIQEGRP